MKLSFQYSVPDRVLQKCSEITGMEIVSDPRDSDAVIFGRDPKFGPDTRMFQCLFAGTDHISVDSLPRGSVLLSNAGAYSEPVAETVFALILARIKQVCEHNSDFHNVKFNRRSVTSLYGKSMGIIGYGGIGRKVAHIARSMDMSIYVTSGHKVIDEGVTYLDSLLEIFQKSYIVVISVPLKSETEGFINKSLLDNFTGSMIVNIARADIVDRSDMLDFLSRNPEKYFLTDVWWDEPNISGPVPDNCIVTPHIGGMGKDALIVAAERACMNLKSYLDGKPRNVVCEL